jgi:hypothetical protein
MTGKTEISSFDAGVLCALAALRVAIQSMPGFNETALKETAEALQKSLGGVTDKQAFNLPLSMILSDHSNIVEAMMRGDIPKRD